MTQASLTRYLGVRHRVRATIALLRARSAIVTASDRSHERYRRLALTALATLGTRVTAVVSMLVSVPLLVHALGTQGYGLWVTLTSLISVLAVSDLGLGNGLVSAVSASNGRGDREEARELVSSATFALVGVGAVLGIAFLVAYPFVPWSRVFNVTSARVAHQTGHATLVLMAVVLTGVPLGVVTRTQAAYQEGFVTAMFQGVANVLGLALVIVGVVVGVSLPWLLLARLGTSNLASVANGLMLFERRPWLRPRLASASRRCTVYLGKVGLWYFVIQLAITVGYLSDPIVIARVLGAGSVPEYAVPMALFTLVPLGLSLVLGPLWAAYAEALAQGDSDWVGRAMRRSLALSVAISAVPTIVLVVWGPAIISLWVGGSVRTTPLLLLGLGAATMLTALSGPIATFLNGVNAVKWQGCCAALMAIANLPLSIVLAHAVGVSGVVWGTVLAQVVFILLPNAYYVPRALRRIESTQAIVTDGLAFPKAVSAR